MCLNHLMGVVICRYDLSEDRDVNELPDFCLPVLEPLATGYQVILDTENDGPHKVDDNHQPNKPTNGKWNGRH